MEQPAGTRDFATGDGTILTRKIYTPEQQSRLSVDESGQHKRHINNGEVCFMISLYLATFNQGHGKSGTMPRQITNFNLPSDATASDLYDKVNAIMSELNMPSPVEIGRFGCNGILLLQKNVRMFAFKARKKGSLDACLGAQLCSDFLGPRRDNVVLILAPGKEPVTSWKNTMWDIERIQRQKKIPDNCYLDYLGNIKRKPPPGRPPSKEHQSLRQLSQEGHRLLTEALAPEGGASPSEPSPPFSPSEETKKEMMSPALVLKNCNVPVPAVRPPGLMHYVKGTFKQRTMVKDRSGRKHRMKPKFYMECVMCSATGSAISKRTSCAKCGYGQKHQTF